MKATDLKPAVEYSTCNGELVVPVEPIHSNWFKVYDVERNEWDLVDGGDQARAKADPWGGCHRPPKPGMPRSRRTKPGVLVDRYEFDRDGRRIEESAERTIVQAKDIVGTWKEYLTLYADVVRRKIDAEREEAERDAAIEAIKEYIADEYGVEDVDLWYRNGGSSIEAKFTVPLAVPRSKAKNPPDPHVRVAKSLGLNPEVGA